MDDNSSYITRRSFYIVAALSAAMIIISMTTCLIISSIRENSLKSEILNSVNSDITARTEMNNSLIFHYLSTINSSSSQTKMPEALYQLKEHNGKIAVVSTDGSIIEILDVYVFTLPETDKSQLLSGIPLYSETELLSIIQDYTS